MSGKKTGSGLGARMAVALPVSAVAAGFAAATEPELPENEPPEPAHKSEPPAKPEVVALNIRLPKELHRTLREIAFKDETSINAILIHATEEWLARTR